MRVEFVDLPRLYSFEEDICGEFYGALAETENFELFKIPAVHALISYQYPVVRKYITRRLMIPFCTFLLLFMIW